MVARNRAVVFAFALTTATVLALGSRPTAAQEPAAEKPAPAAPTPPAAKKTYDPTRRVPPFFGQVGLTPEQKEAIYKVRARHQMTIEGLQRQLVQAQAEMLAECETVLNEDQKKLLVIRREASAKARKERASAKSGASAPEKAADKTGND